MLQMLKLFKNELTFCKQTPSLRASVHFPFAVYQKTEIFEMPPLGQQISTAAFRLAGRECI